MIKEEQIIQIKELKSPKGHFLLGHLPQFKTNNKHLVLERWIEECGDLFKINFVGKEFVVSANAKMNEQILKLRPEKFRRFSKIDEIFQEIGITGVFNAEGEMWKKHRKTTSEALKIQNVKTFFPVLKNKTENILNKLQRFSSENQTIDIQKELMSFTVDITTEIAFGYKIDTINNAADSFQKELEIIFPMINERITAPIATWRYIKSKKDKQLLSAIKSIETLVYTFISEAKKRLEENPKLRENPSNFLEALLVEKGDSEFTDKEIYSNVFSMLLAGEDTTSNSISWAIYFLTQNPEIVLKLREEANNVFEGSTPNSNDDLGKLKLAKAVALEAIRLKPTTPQLYFEANEDVIIENLKIKKGTNLILQNKVPQTSEVHFTNANEFAPERWIPSECPMHKNHSPNVMKSFGGGPRFCPGMALAINEMVILLSSISKSFDIELMVNPEDIEEFFAFTMHPKNLLISLKKPSL